MCARRRRMVRPDLEAPDVYPVEATESTKARHGGCRLPCETQLGALLSSEEEEERAIREARLERTRQELIDEIYGREAKGR